MASTTFDKPLDTEVDSLREQIDNKFVSLGNISNTSKTISSSAANFILICVGNSDGRMGMWLCKETTSDTRVKDIAASPNVTITVNNNKQIVVTTGVTAVYFFAIMLEGEISIA